jgi:hypothetical protein
MFYPERRLSMAYISLEILSLSYVISMSPPPKITLPPVPETLNLAAGAAGASDGSTNAFNKPATISVTIFLLIAAVAVTALVVRKYKRTILMSGAGGMDDQSVLTEGSLVGPV